MGECPLKIFHDQSPRNVYVCGRAGIRNVLKFLQVKNCREIVAPRFAVKRVANFAAEPGNNTAY